MAAPFPLLKGTKIWHSESYPGIDPSRPELSAKGKTVVVSGGGSGIGAAIAKAFAAAGAPQIAIFGRRHNVLQTTKAEIERDYPSAKVSTVTTDVSNATEVDAAFDEIARKLGKIDVLVSNSGFLSTPSTIASSDFDDWWRSMETNVKGAFLVSRAFLRHAAKDAYLLNISTGIGHMPAIPGGMSAYAASKAAAIKLFEYVALENPGIHVVNVHPGVVESDMNRKSGLPGLDHVNLPGHFCLWLTSPEAAFLKSKYVWVNWDVDDLKAMKEEILTTDLLDVKLGGVSFTGWSWGN